MKYTQAALFSTNQSSNTLKCLWMLFQLVKYADFTSTVTGGSYYKVGGMKLSKFWKKVESTCSTELCKRLN